MGYNPIMEFEEILTLGTILLVLGGYLAGSMSAAILVCRTLGLSDPRLAGSKNPGATNVMRLHGKQAAFLTLAGDVAKGVAPVLIARVLDFSFSVQVLVGLTAFLGHIYPLYFNFKGGKGVATAYGVLFSLNWQVGLACGTTWVLVYLLRKISSLAALTAFALLPLFSWFLTGSKPLSMACILIAVLIYWRHRSNIKNLLAGEEQ